MSELPKCPTYMAHPQSVWFETHWRPILESSLEQNKKLEAELLGAGQDNALLKQELAEVKREGCQLAIDNLSIISERDHALESVKMAYEALYCNDKCLGGVDCYCGMEEIIKKIRERHNL